MESPPEDGQPPWAALAAATEVTVPPPRSLHLGNERDQDQDLFEHTNMPERDQEALSDDGKEHADDVAASAAANDEQIPASDSLQSPRVDAGDGGNIGSHDLDTEAHGDADITGPQDGQANNDADNAAEFGQPQAQSQATEAGNANTCKICFDSLEPDEFIYINCGCLYCVECLNAHFRSGLANKASYPPRCCGAIDVAAVQGFLDDENMVRYTTVLEEFAAARPLYCANEECEKDFIGDAAQVDLLENQGMVFCPECAVQTCAKCRELHDAHTDNEGVLECPDSLVLAEVKEMADEENWRRCPGCRHLVEKIDGCDHMM